MPRPNQPVPCDGIGSWIGPPLQSMSGLSRPPLHISCYPAPVMTDICLLLAEVLIVAIIVGALVGPRPPGSRLSRLGAIAAVLASLTSVAGGVVVYAAFTAPHLLVGLYSWSRFLVDFLVLGSVVGLSWCVLASPALAGPKMRLRSRRILKTERRQVPPYSV